MSIQKNVYTRVYTRVYKEYTQEYKKEGFTKIWENFFSGFPQFLELMLIVNVSVTLY